MCHITSYFVETTDDRSGIFLRLFLPHEPYLHTSWMNTLAEAKFHLLFACVQFENKALNDSPFIQWEPIKQNGFLNRNNSTLSNDFPFIAYFKINSKKH